MILYSRGLPPLRGVRRGMIAGQVDNTAGQWEVKTKTKGWEDGVCVGRGEGAGSVCVRVCVCPCLIKGESLVPLVFMRHKAIQFWLLISLKRIKTYLLTYNWVELKYTFVSIHVTCSTLHFFFPYLFSLSLFLFIFWPKRIINNLTCFFCYLLLPLHHKRDLGR